MFSKSFIKISASIMVVMSSTFVKANEVVKLTKEELQVLQELINRKIIVKNQETNTLDLNQLLKDKSLIKELDSINSRNCTGDGPPF